MELAKGAWIADPLRGWRMDVVAPSGGFRAIPWWEASYHGFLSRSVSAMWLESAPTVQHDGRFTVVSPNGDSTYACQGAKSEHSPNGRGYPVSVWMLRPYPESPLPVGKFETSSALLDFFKRKANGS